MPEDRTLRQEIRWLGTELGHVLEHLAGQPALEMVESIRRLARARRQGKPGTTQELTTRLAQMSVSELRVIVRAFTLFLDLANVAEDRQRVRVLRERTRQSHPGPRRESIGEAIAQLRSSGMKPAQLATLLNRLDIELVLTAHPTEAKRRSVRTKLRTLRYLLRDLDERELLPKEADQLRESIRAEITKLWQTDFIRPWRPTVLQEVQRGLSFRRTLWQVVPEVMQDLRTALSESYPDGPLEAPSFLRFGSWVGGDRDGHPYVKADITAETLQVHRAFALELHLESCRALHDSISLSENHTPASAQLKANLRAALERWPELEKFLAATPPPEIYRRWLQQIEWRLQSALRDRIDSPAVPGAYQDELELAEDVRILQESLAASHNELIVHRETQRWLDQIATFGFFVARLDVRQDSGYHAEVLTDLFRRQQLTENYRELPEPEKCRLLMETLGKPLPLEREQLSEESRETLALFEVLRRWARRYGTGPLGGAVVSMTHHLSDVLAPLWFWKWSATLDGGDASDDELRIPILPLFETIDDLRRAPETLTAMLEHPDYARYVRELGSEQIIMVGYSDSTKDGGYLSACWALYESQLALHTIARQHEIAVTFFHGRGGSLGRGGGPMARSILSLPANTLDGTLRLTEQGEVLPQRYDDLPIAHRHLEQLTWSMLLASGAPRLSLNPEWSSVMERLGELSFRAYRELVEQPGFVPFLRETTPLEEIEQLPIGSRPSRRKGDAGLGSLRAIPWVFSWTQCRCLIPAWYGLGTAIQQLQREDARATQQLETMYRDWSFFQALIDNAALALAKSDLSIAQQYADLSQDDDTRGRLETLISSEYERSRLAVLEITGDLDLLDDIPWLRRSIQVRNLYVDPLNFIQVELFRRLRGQSTSASEQELDELRHVVRLTIQGIAAGMRTTG